MIDQIDSIARVQAVQILKNKAGKLSLQEYLESNKSLKSKKVNRSHYAIGVCLLEFMVERKIITFQTDAIYTDVLPVSKKKGYIASNCYA